MQSAEASAERVMALLNTESDITDSPEILKKYGDILHPYRENWEDIAGDITFENVSFSYKGKGDESGTTIYFNNSLTVTLSGLEDGKEYIISKTVGGETTPLVYFIIYQQMDGKTSLLSKDSSESEYVARPTNVIVVTP